MQVYKSDSVNPTPNIVQMGPMLISTQLQLLYCAAIGKGISPKRHRQRASTHTISARGEAERTRAPRSSQRDTEMLISKIHARREAPMHKGRQGLCQGHLAVPEKFGSASGNVMI